MKIKRHKNFKKQFKELPVKIQNKFEERILLLLKTPNIAILNNHQLKGILKNHWSINIIGDIRVIYKIIDKQIYFFLLIGTHSELYKKQ